MTVDHWWHMSQQWKSHAWFESFWTRDTCRHFLSWCERYLIARPGEEALHGDGASRGWKRGLHHAAHERINQRRGDFSAPLHLFQDLDRESNQSVTKCIAFNKTLMSEWTWVYLCKQVETAQLADDTVNLRKPLPLSAGLQDKSFPSHKTEYKSDYYNKKHVKMQICTLYNIINRAERVQSQKCIHVYDGTTDSLNNKD